jgi:hypothetical protein
MSGQSGALQSVAAAILRKTIGQNSKGRTENEQTDRAAINRRDRVISRIYCHDRL